MFFDLGWSVFSLPGPAKATTARLRTAISTASSAQAASDIMCGGDRRVDAEVPHRFWRSVPPGRRWRASRSASRPRALNNWASKSGKLVSWTRLVVSAIAQARSWTWSAGSSARLIVVRRFNRRRFNRRPAQDLGDRLVESFGAIALGHHLEMGRHAGFERKAAQDRLAEGMDGHDLHAAGHVEHGGKEPAGPDPFVILGGPAEQAWPSYRRQLVLRRRHRPKPPAPVAMRIAISAAAALVKVRQRILLGRAPASIRVSTRSVRTLVLPEPAEAETQTETARRAGRLALKPVGPVEDGRSVGPATRRSVIGPAHCLLTAGPIP